MIASVQAVSAWLAATPLSVQIQTDAWIIPTIQTIHILSIAIVTSSATMVDLRLLGAWPRGQPLAAVALRFVPWIWWALLVLAITGTTLVIGEPERSLGNPAFLLKMCLLVTALLLTLLLQKSLRRDARFWERSRRRQVGGRLLAAVSLLLWVGIVFAGRWIAYVDLGAT